MPTPFVGSLLGALGQILGHKFFPRGTRGFPEFPIWRAFRALGSFTQVAFRGLSLFGLAALFSPFWAGLKISPLVMLRRDSVLLGPSKPGGFPSFEEKTFGVETVLHIKGETLSWGVTRGPSTNIGRFIQRVPLWVGLSKILGSREIFNTGRVTPGGF